MTFTTPTQRARAIPPCPFPDPEQREQPVLRRGSNLYRELEQKRIEADTVEFERRERLKREAKRRQKINKLISRAGLEIDSIPACAQHTQHFDRANRIFFLCCEVMSCTQTDLTSDSRKRPLVKKRQISMMIMHAETSLSLPQIGRKFHRDHSTIIHARQKIEDDPQLFEDFKTVRSAVLELEREMYGQQPGQAETPKPMFPFKAAQQIWREGGDTAEISSVLNIPESEVWNNMNKVKGRL